MKYPNCAAWILLVVPLGFVLGLSTGSPVTANVAPPAPASGTFFFESVTGSTGQGLNGFLTLHEGGTATWADQSDFGAAGFFNSTAHGVWRRTGPDEVTVEGYYYRFDPNGVPVVLVRITTVGSLAGGHGTGTVDVFGPAQNPVTEAPMIPNADSIRTTSFRMN